MDKKQNDMFCRFKACKNARWLCNKYNMIVNMKEHKLIRLKSHDFLILMHHILLLTICTTLLKKVSVVIVEFNTFFRELHSKVLQIE